MLHSLSRRIWPAGLLVIGLVAAPIGAAYDALPARGTDLTGHWILNQALSDDAEHALAERLDKQRRRQQQWQREQERLQPPGSPHPGAAIADLPAGSGPRLRPWQQRRYEDFRKMLGMTVELTIRQHGAIMEILAALDSRRLESGTRSQVSLPEGELADSQVGWDGDWFVIDRRVRRGPQLTEKFRLLKSGQLEYRLAVGGNSELSGIKLRRLFDRAGATRAPGNPTLGPVR